MMVHCDVAVERPADADTKMSGELGTASDRRELGLLQAGKILSKFQTLGSRESSNHGAALRNFARNPRTILIHPLSEVREMQADIRKALAFAPTAW